MPSAGTLIRPETTTLVVIDFQKKLVPAIAEIEPVLENAKKLLRLAQALKLKTFLTTQYRRGLGETVPEIAELAAAEPAELTEPREPAEPAEPVEPIDKVCFGCMGDDVFRAALSNAVPAGGTLLLTGIESHICVMQTALGALDQGYAVHVAADAVGARSPSNHVIGVERMRGAGAVITSTEMAIYELLGDSARPEFRQMLPFLK